MIDLHTHSIFSDGALIPSELVRRAQVLNIKGIAITDHGDFSNFDIIIPGIAKVAKELNRVLDITVIPGIEITHVPPSLILDAAKNARDLGAKIVIVHGETIAEPVAPGTNRAGLLANIDILGHPGLITEEEVIIAKEKGVCLEITSRRGHSLANGHVAHLSKKVGAKLLINTDAHSPSDLIDYETAKKVAIGAGLTENDFSIMQENAKEFI